MISTLSPSAGSSLDDVTTLADALELAIAAGELLVHYQPLVTLATGEVAGAEALVRWRRDGVVLAPAEFMPAAEAAGLMPAVDRAIIATVCRDAARIPETMPIAVNLSTALVFSEDAVAAWSEPIEAAGLRPGRITVEITDGLNQANRVQTLVALERLRRLGLDIALDDFGAGAASIADLRAYRFKRFKIEKGFIDEIDRNPQALQLVQAMAQIAHALGAEATAEGVERAKQADLAALAGCTLAQGYYFSPPLPLRDFLDYCADKRPRCLAVAG